MIEVKITADEWPPEVEGDDYDDEAWLEADQKLIDAVADAIAAGSSAEHLSQAISNGIEIAGGS
jgi:hypothetical protein